ncbi:MAG: hypothetical protein D6698_01570 [Gammaproteobacteria bacterium]|nr:MAG: hypothetical protein D6698_01570 [Gammaproteobacteria bacterium]
MPRNYHIPEIDTVQLLEAIYGCRFQKRGNSWFTTCPLGHHKNTNNLDLRVYEGGGWVCHKHGKGTVWDLLEQQFGLPGWEARDSEDFDETILFVCRHLNIDPIPTAQKQKLPPSHYIREIYRDLRSLLKPIPLFNHPDFQTDSGGLVLWRGIDTYTWLSYGVGYLDTESLSKFVSKHGKKLREAGFYSYQGNYDYLSYGPLILRKNKHNNPVGFAVRNYTTDNPKYFNNKTHVLMNYQDYVFNLHNVTSKEPIYVVEGQIDALALTIRGLDNVVAIETTQMRPGQYAVISSFGSPVIVAFDSGEEEAGFKASCELAKKYPDLRFILLPPVDPKKTDPDLYVQVAGISGFKALRTFSSLQMEMASYPLDENKRWKHHRQELMAHFLSRIAAGHSPYEAEELETLSVFSGVAIQDLTRYVTQTRLTKAFQLLNEHPDRIYINIKLL